MKASSIAALAFFGFSALVLLPALLNLMAIWLSMVLEAWDEIVWVVRRNRG